MLEVMPARAAHIGPIVEIWKDFMDYHGALDPFFLRTADAHLSFESFLRECMGCPDSLVLVAVEEGKVVGYALARLQLYPPVVREKYCAYINDLAVRRDQRQHGVGTLLTNKILTWARSRGIRRIELRVLSPNNAAQKFWRKLGFTGYAEEMLLNITRDKSPNGESDTAGIHVSPLPEAGACIFCDLLTEGNILLQNELAFGILDRFPVTAGHTLILPRRHVEDYFELTEMERLAVDELLRFRRSRLMEKDRGIEGFNLGVNCGTAAGQTVMHCHMHLIPRRKGDVAQPRGGVRGVIPEKQDYRT